jgi:hypothetical protein
MTFPKHFWRVPAYLPYLQPELTDEAVAEAERILGVVLPTFYVEALRIQNGGYVRNQDFPGAPAPVRTIAGIGPRFPSLTGHDWSEVKEHMAERGITNPDTIDALVPFSGDGHYHFCFDYRACGPAGEPSIAYLDTECFDHDEVLAPDFLTFVNGLEPSGDDDLIGLASTRTLSRTAAALSTCLGVRFEQQEQELQGYPHYRAKVGSGARPSWLWLEPNLVKRGFVRKRERDYAKLVNLLPGEDYRYPEHKDCDLVLVCGVAPKEIETILRKLSAGGMDAKRIPR